MSNSACTQQVDAGIALLAMEPESAIQTLSELAIGGDSLTRWVATGILHDFCTESEEAVIAKVAEFDTDPDIRILAVSTLERVGSARSLPVLERIVELDNGSDFEGRAVCESARKAIFAVHLRMTHKGAVPVDTM